MKKGVIQLIDSLAVGGAEMMSINIANALVASDIDSHLCATRAEGQLKEKIGNSVKYIFIDKKNLFDIKSILKLRFYIKKHQISIVHAHSSSFFIALCVKLIMPRIKIVWHDHYGKSEYLDQRPSKALKISSLFFSQIISVNQTLKKWGQEILKHSNVIYLPNFASFETNIKAKTVLKGENEYRIVKLAALRPQKDHLNLLRAFKKVSKSIPKSSLHIIGKDHNDTYSESIHKYIKDNELKNVFFYDACNDVEHILSQATIGVLSSNSEGLPVALLEYGLSKLPVIVTDVGQCSEIIKNNDTGFIVEKENAIQLSQKIKLLLENSELAKKVSNNLYKEIKLNYSKEKYVKRLKDIYESF